jgi:hypothetical protein
VVPLTFLQPAISSLRNGFYFFRASSLFLKKPILTDSLAIGSTLNSTDSVLSRDYILSRRVSTAYSRSCVDSVSLATRV